MHHTPSHDSHSLIVTAQGASPQLRVVTLNASNEWVGFSIGTYTRYLSTTSLGTSQGHELMCTPFGRHVGFTMHFFLLFVFSLTGVVKVRKLYGGGATDQYYIPYCGSH